MTVRPDSYTKIVLTVIALLLGALAAQPLINPAPARAQADPPALFIEPGLTRIPDQYGNETLGKMMIDLKTGEAWGFPMVLAVGREPVSKPTYIGRFDLSAMKRNR